MKSNIYRERICNAVVINYEIFQKKYLKSVDLFMGGHDIMLFIITISFMEVKG